MTVYQLHIGMIINDKIRKTWKEQAVPLF